jgi:hypothetical protein
MLTIYTSKKKKPKELLHYDRAFARPILSFYLALDEPRLLLTPETPLSLTLIFPLPSLLRAAPENFVGL